ncbi:DUF6545 domain-containing protein [Streptomyces sp. NPDC091268]|uniref:DUF6545 domain-containing protein n=1 Tax=Streptomyces sp. NPDC091268 TaxID=3365979 RepID=UPI00381AB101
MGEGVNYYVPAVALGLVLVAKLPALVRGWRSPMVRAVNALLAMACAAFVFSAPPTIVVVNRLTGVSNFSAPFVYCILCAYSCACLVLVENWREDSRFETRSRRRVQAWVLAYGLVIVAIIACFAAGEAPVERLRDFDTYYATTPFIREMLVLYMLAHATAAFATTAVCRRWALDISRETRTTEASIVGRSLQIGLGFLVVGFLVNGIFGLVKLTAVCARWAGRDWDVLNRMAGSFISLNAGVCMCGFLLPVFGPWLVGRVWRPWRAFAALRPLGALVGASASGSGKQMFLATPWYSSPEQLLMYRLTNIRDGMLRLRGYCDDDVREAARRDALARGVGERDAVAHGLAAMFEAAAAARAARSPADGPRSVRAAEALRTAEAEDRDLMTRVARALPASGARPARQLSLIDAQL